MKWFTAIDLEDWANRIAARVTFPELIRDLIMAVASDISDIRFPGGDKGQVRGFDGWLEAAGSFPYVPGGKSIWEFGVNDDPAKKFLADYSKRVKEIHSYERANLTFVFATPRTWDNPQKKLPDFVREYKSKADFKDVRYIDGSQLEDWLHRSSAVAAQYARDVLGRMPQLGARSTDEFWDEYRKRFRPQITEDVVLSARADEATQIVTHLAGRPGPLLFVADGLDEVCAVAVAAIRKADPKLRAYLEARTLIIDTEEAGRFLATPDRYGFILSSSVSKVAGLLSTVGPTVSGQGFGASRQNIPQLTRSSTRDMALALITMGLSEDDATKLASKSGRSLTILERHIPAAAYAAPIWANEGLTLVPALIAGAWDSRHEGDREILAELANLKEYLEYEAKLRTFLNRHDSPIDREGGIWKLRAPVDALVHLSSFLGDEHLTQLGRISSRIFTAAPPDAGEERFNVSKAPFSSILRDGVANSLLMLAALHSEIGLTFGMDPETWVQQIIAELPGLNSDPRVILSLERQLPALMEAAADPLLLALEHLLEGELTTIAQIFDEKLEFGYPRSNLPSLLNALEVAAWDPNHLMRVSLLLARMAELDPGGKSRNRPLQTLQETFMAWKPETNASLEIRLAAVDAIYSASPLIGWKLLIGLLPKSHAHKMPNMQPRFRDSGASQRETLTVATVSATYDAITDRVLALLGNDLERWLAVLEAFPLFSPQRRTQFLDALADFANHLQDEQRLIFRRQARALADRHSRFREAKWALSDSDLHQLSAVVTSLAGNSPSDDARVLFDEWSPIGFTDYIEAERQIAERRRQVVERVLQIEGVDSVLQLSRQVRVPENFATATAQACSDAAVLFELIDRSPLDGPGKGFAISLASAMRWKYGSDFDSEFLAAAKAKGWDDQRIATLMLGWPETPTTWAVVSELDTQAAASFWENRQPRRFEGTSAELATLIGHYLAANRPSAALAVLHLREHDISWDLIDKILASRVREINHSKNYDTMDGYYIEELFKHLRVRNDVSKHDIARWEFSYFPALEDRGEPLIIFEYMATDPNFYVSLLKAVYMEDDANPDAIDTSDEERRLATSAYRILAAFDRSPGEIDGIVDGQLLNVWIDGVLEAASRERRLGVVYGYIGRTLAHSAEKDGCWPQLPIADVIERLKSKQLTDGIGIERFNMRGVHTKNLFEGGDQERALAEKYREWGKALSPIYNTTRAMLESIAKNWDLEAKEADEAAARDKLRFN